MSFPSIVPPTATPAGEWNRVVSIYPRMRTVHSLFEEWVEDAPAQIAVRDGWNKLTYRELNSAANALAWKLIDSGVSCETPVGILMNRSASMVIAMLGILKAGGRYVPFDPQLPANRIRFIAADTAVHSLITHVAEPQPDVLSYLPAMSLPLGLDDEQARGNPPERSSPESSAYIMYTSGSTGRPKGVEVLHRGIVRLVRNTNYVDLDSTDVMAQVANQAFDAITFEVWGALLNGATLSIVPTETILSPNRFRAAIRDQGISTMFLTASLFAVMAATEPDAFETMRTLIVGGDAVDPSAARSILQAAPPARLVNGYGPTECTTFSVCHWIQSVDENALSVPIGRPICNSEAYILTESLEPVSSGTVGDLYLGGDGLARGYLNLPELTKARFIAHPFDETAGARLYKTGDRARFLSDGVIEFAGRNDHQVKYHGFRIELGEIETALRKHPSVVDAVAMVICSSPIDERLVVYVAARPEEEDKLRSYLKEELPAYMIPSHFVFLKALPLNSVGKVDRSALPCVPAGDSTRTARDGSDELETAIAGIWAKVLAVPAVSLDANFFDIGGTSLTLAVVDHELRRVTQKPFETIDLFRFPTIRSFSAFCKCLGSKQQKQQMTAIRAKLQRDAFRVGRKRYSAKAALAD